VVLWNPAQCPQAMPVASRWGIRATEGQRAAVRPLELLAEALPPRPNRLPWLLPPMPSGLLPALL